MNQQTGCAFGRMLGTGLVVGLCLTWGLWPAMTAATPLDRDYFSKDWDPEVTRDVVLIDKAHTDIVLTWVRQERLDNAVADLKFTLDRLPNHPRALALMGMVGRLKKNPLMVLPY